ncbi:MAG: GNAT family N-acetyltransferase [Chitinophagaceae bacterium]|nr:GNAT family N-acetyltransferase [Chitinophagaceae bacterium]
MVEVKVAIANDAQEILDIYASYVINTSVTFETEVPTVEQFADRIAFNLEHRPWLVCVIDNKIVGYAYASLHRERTGYQW